MLTLTGSLVNCKCRFVMRVRFQDLASPVASASGVASRRKKCKRGGCDLQFCLRNALPKARQRDEDNEEVSTDGPGTVEHWRVQLVTPGDEHSGVAAVARPPGGQRR